MIIKMKIKKVKCLPDEKILISHNIFKIFSYFKFMKISEKYFKFFFRFYKFSSKIIE